MATTPDSHAGGPRFESRYHPTKSFGAQTPPYPASRSQRCVKGPKRDGVRESRAPGMTKNTFISQLYYLSFDSKIPILMPNPLFICRTTVAASTSCLTSPPSSTTGGGCTTKGRGDSGEGEGPQPPQQTTGNAKK